MSAAGSTRPGYALEARGVAHGFGGRSALRGVDLRLPHGEVVALVGPNGAGKTTLMKVIVGLVQPRRGAVSAPDGGAVGWVPQGGAIYQRMTVRENLELFARLLGLPQRARLVARQAAEGADLMPWFDALGSELSGGLRQRLNVAVGLLGDPSVLVLDEPSTGVDLVHRTALFRILRERVEAGCTVLYSTHSIEEAALADRVVVLVDGAVAFDGQLHDIADPDEAPGEPGSPDAISRGLLRLWGSAE